MARHFNRPVRLYQTLMRDEEPIGGNRGKKPSEMREKAQVREEMLEDAIRRSLEILSTAQLREIARRECGINIRLGVGARKRCIRAIVQHRMKGLNSREQQGRRHA